MVHKNTYESSQPILHTPQKKRLDAAQWSVYTSTGPWLQTRCIQSSQGGSQGRLIQADALVLTPSSTDILLVL